MIANVRYATLEDATYITEHRHKMFADNLFASESELAKTDLQFESWVRECLSDGRYVGLLIEEKGEVVAGAGVFFAEFPPHWMDPQPLRAYILNVYTRPEHRGKGFAKQLTRALIEECRKRAVPTVVLHASPQGQPIYKSMGFHPTDEMMLRLDLGSEGTTMCA